MNQRRLDGFTLTELMVSVAIGLVVLAGIMTFYLSTARTGTEALKIARLNQYLRAAMDLMVSDIRRAGYWAGSGGQYRNSGGYITNPFASGNNDVATGNKSGEAAQSCIRFTYDANKDGAVQTSGSPLERFGFRLNANKLEMRQSGSESEVTCDNGIWFNMIDEVEISALEFKLEPASPISNPYGAVSPNDVFVRTVKITVTGKLKSDANIARTVGQTVRIRNDKFGPIP